MKRCADVLRLARYVRIEKSFRHDIEREAHHGFVDVEPLTVLPGGEHSFRVRHHDFRVGRDSLLVKGRLDQLALPPPELPLAGQQPIAQDAKKHNVAVLANAFREVSDGVPAWFERIAHDGEALGAGRELQVRRTSLSLSKTW